jgi:hypothetical protein
MNALRITAAALISLSAVVGTAAPTRAQIVVDRVHFHREHIRVIARTPDELAFRVAQMEGSGFVPEGPMLIEGIFFVQIMVR